MKKLLIFHPIIAPYRIDFFNQLSEYFDLKICLSWTNLHDQTLNYSEIEKQFSFLPYYLRDKKLGFQWEVFSIIRKYKPDIVFVSECGIISFAVLLYRWIFRKKYRIISIIDDSYDFIVNGNYFTKRHMIAEKLLIPHFDNIINVEPRVVDYFQTVYKKGVFFPIIANDKIARDRYKKILSVSEQYVKDYQLEGKRVLLFVGRLVKMRDK